MNLNSKPLSHKQAEREFQKASELFDLFNNKELSYRSDSEVCSGAVFCRQMEYQKSLATQYTVCADDNSPDITLQSFEI